MKIHWGKDEQTFYRDLPFEGLTKDLIDQDVEFLKEIWETWSEDA